LIFATAPPLADEFYDVTAVKFEALLNWPSCGEPYFANALEQTHDHLEGNNP
jgi:hypothetical protein